MYMVHAPSSFTRACRLYYSNNSSSSNKYVACPPPTPSYVPPINPPFSNPRLSLSPHHIDLAPSDPEQQLLRPLGLDILLDQLPVPLGLDRALGQFARVLPVGVGFGDVDAFGPLLEPVPEGAGGAVEGR